MIADIGPNTTDVILSSLALLGSVSAALFAFLARRQGRTSNGTSLGAAAERAALEARRSAAQVAEIARAVGAPVVDEHGRVVEHPRQI